MSSLAIEVTNLSKQYRIGEREPYRALRDVLARALRAPFRGWLPFTRPMGSSWSGSGLQSPVPSLQSPVPTLHSPLSTLHSSNPTHFWALKDVSFSVEAGEVVGIIGRNGAGKSTLLKILSRITKPTSGHATVYGRVGSLLEVGTGFHPELTGRENVYLNGAILGMRRAEIERKFDEIVAFAEVEKFLDTPVKHYSSGMYVRLAFAVAAHMEPEILVVDEVLAVGDAEFQKKCLGKMQDVAGREGRTVLFVSHNMAAIQGLCTKVAYLEGGSLVGYGDVDLEIRRYCRNALNVSSQEKQRHHQLSNLITLESLSISPNPLNSGQPAQFSVELSATELVRLQELSILFYTTSATRVAIADLRSTRFDYLFGEHKRLSFIGMIKNLNLVEGDYSIGIYINCGDLRGDIYDLFPLSIISSERERELAPYAPLHRGYLDLDFEFRVDNPSYP
jgi:lipopolysaccharide transport system ATP-binding protein